MAYIAYLDEFGHIGPYVARSDPTHNISPVFGLAGIVLPLEEVRAFGTWFFQRKRELLAWEIERDDEHPALWEKKGSSLYTVRNVERYPELKSMTYRLMNRLSSCGGHVFYCGVKKPNTPTINTKLLYRRILRESIKRLDQHCEDEAVPYDQFLLVLDQHDYREALITTAARTMYNPAEPRYRLVEPPFQVESHRYQTLQAADWISGLVGRLGAVWADSGGYPENRIFRRYFEARLNEISIRSGIRIP